MIDISVLALKWFTSYPINRNISIMIEKSYSHLSPLNQGIPQGFVIGVFSFLFISISSIDDLI